jgi:uncharacterized membrane protein
LAFFVLVFLIAMVVVVVVVVVLKIKKLWYSFLYDIDAGIVGSKCI